MVVLAILIVLSNHMTISNAATESPKVQETTASGCSPQGCSGFEIITGPWGDNQTQNVQLNCKVNVTESQNPGEFSLLLSLDRDTEVVTPHNLQLSKNNTDGLQFTFTNEYIVPVSTFIFDFELSYSIDQGNAAIPDGNCSDGAIVVTTKVTTPTALTSSSTPTAITPATTTSTSVSQPAVTVISPGITTSGITTPTKPASSVTSSSASVSQSTRNTVSSTVVAPTLTVVTSSTLASTQQTSTLQSSPPDSRNTDEGNIFSRIRDGYVYSIVLVAGLSLAVIILLLILACCIYHYACQRQTGNRIFDEAANDRKRQENSAPRKDRQNSASNLLAHQGQVTRTKVVRIGRSTIGLV